MENPTIKKPMTIDEAEVDKLASNGAPDADIAAMLGISEKRLRRRYRKVLCRARATMRTRLRSKQLLTALAGNPTLLTFLGKHELDQNDKKEAGTDPVKTYIGIDFAEV